MCRVVCMLAEEHLVQLSCQPVPVRVHLRQLSLQAQLQTLQLLHTGFHRLQSMGELRIAADKQLALLDEATLRLVKPCCVPLLRRQPLLQLKGSLLSPLAQPLVAYAGASLLTSQFL